jgi:hypothetical protein
MRTAVTVFALWLTAAASLGAQELPEWLRDLQVSGVVFGDAYGVVEHHDPAADGANGFWLRRINLVFDQKMGDRLSARLRFEAASPGNFTSSGGLDPFVKDAYVQWNGDRAQVAAGLTSTPTMDFVEAAWGYRPVERVPVDLQRFGGTRDMGVSVRGNFDAGKRWGYNAMVGNGSGLAAETNEGKKAMVSLTFQPNAAWGFEAYGDVESRPGEADRSTFHLFGFHRGDWGRIGVQGARQVREQPSGEELELDLASVFVVVKAGERSHLLARVDRTFDPNPEGQAIAYLPLDPTAEATIAILGWDYALAEKLNVIPNVEWVTYEHPEGGPDPDDDLLVRLTASWRF